MGPSQAMSYGTQAIGAEWDSDHPTLKNTPDSWIGLSDLRRRHCEISEKEYNTFFEWIRAARVLPAEALGTHRLTLATISAVLSMQTDNSGEIRVGAISRFRLPTSIVGSVQ